MISGLNIATILSGAVEAFRIASTTPCRWWPCRCSTSGAPDGRWPGCRGAATRSCVRDIDPVEILRLIEEHRITDTFFVPAVLMFLLATPQLADTDVGSLRTLSTVPRPSARTCW